MFGPTRPANDAAELAERIRREPVRFVADFFGETALGKQREILESVRDNDATYVRSAHDVGKTYAAARIVLWFLMAHPGDAIVVTTATSWTQVEMLLWKEIAQAVAKSQVPLGGRLLTTKLELGPRWYAIGLATDQPVNLQGYHASNVLVVIDEADGVSPEVWTALDGVLTSGNAKLLAVGNPLDPTSEFKKRHDAAPAKARARCIRIGAEDVLPLTDTGKYPFLLQRSWVEEKRVLWGESSALYMGKVLAEWPDEGSNTLVPISWLQKAKGRSVQKGPRAIGVDVARFGSSRTVRTLVEGNWLAWTKATSKEDTMQTAGRVYVDIDQLAPLATVVDDTGVGGAVTDRLREMGKYVTAVNFGGRAMDERRFANRGSEIYWHARQAFESNLIGFDMSDPEAIDELVADLNQPKYDTDAQGRIRVDKYGVGRGHTERSLSDDERVARSPDRGDSYVLAYSAVLPMLPNCPVVPETELQRMKREVIEQVMHPQDEDAWGI